MNKRRCRTRVNESYESLVIFSHGFGRGLSVDSLGVSLLISFGMRLTGISTPLAIISHTSWNDRGYCGASAFFGSRVA